ncbi:MAG TPA: LamG domain-containing protein, partial [Dehalococcoidia bacterium]|nr:LamG domain-containing protein [Dehalococcoidia bacterium]
MGEWRTGGMILPPWGTGLGWNHILITYDATSTSNTPMLYLNGVSYPFFIYLTNNPDGSYTGIKSDPCIIGNRSGQDRTFEGSIADFAVWNKVLTSEDAVTLYAAQAGPIYYTYRNFDLIGYGERLSPTGSQYEMTLQGLDAQKDDIYYPSLLPRIRQGAPMSLWRGGDKLSDKYFDDTLSLNPDPNDMRGENDVKISQRINFDWEQLDFGQAPTTQQGTPYVETQKFNPVAY